MRPRDEMVNEDFGGWTTYTARHRAYVDPLDEAHRQLDSLEEMIDGMLPDEEEMPSTLPDPRLRG